jgi:signal transduction histidine kinase
LDFASVLLAKTFRSRTFQLALISIGVFGAIVLALLGYVYWSTASFVLGREDRAIEAEATMLRYAYDRTGRTGLSELIKQRIADKAHSGAIYLLADRFFMPLAGNLQGWPTPPTLGWNIVEREVSTSGAASRHLARALSETLPDGSHLLVGRDVDDLNQFARKIGTALGCGILLIVVLAGVATVFVTRRTVGRIEAINATSREIMEKGLDRRIELRGTRDEWDHLAENLNLMLDRIETLMREVRQVTDSVAHDLRTPLTRMRGRLEKAFVKSRIPDDDQQLMGDMIADLDDVLRIFSSLMRISQIEASDRVAAFKTVNLAEIAREVVELFDASAENKGVRLLAAGDQQVFATGDRDLLFDAIANLVDNAIKHGHEAGRVVVTVATSDNGAVVAVADDGPGIPRNELPHIFKRFYRLERSRCSPGNGLGLSLVAAVARLHGARIDMEDNRPGLTFRLFLPCITGNDGPLGVEARSAAN